MRQFLLLIPAAGIALATAAVVLPAWADTKSYSLSNFDRVDVSAGIEVVLQQGPYAVSVDERSGKFDRIVVEVRGNTLHVGRKNQGWSLFDWGGGPRYTVTVNAPAYTGFNISSGSSVEGRNLSLRDVKVNVSSGAHLELAGACAALRVDISSGANFDGEDLKCQSARVDASSGAHAEAFATQSASGDASSGANVTFHGKPASFEKDTSSGGSVRSL